MVLVETTSAISRKEKDLYLRFPWLNENFQINKRTHASKTFLRKLFLNKPQVSAVFFIVTALSI